MSMPRTSSPGTSLRSTFSRSASPSSIACGATKCTEVAAATFGAANVTAIWDGYDKHHTGIGADVRTGSDTIMVAPVTIGDGAMTGAGSVISKDVPPGALAVERTEQRTVEGYRDRKDAQNRARTAKGE